MNVTTIKATIQYSRQLPDGAWKKVELGAEATTGTNGNGEATDENWRTAQRNLYYALKKQLTDFWPTDQRQPDTAPVPASLPEPAAPPDDVCPNHPGKTRPSTKHPGFHCTGKMADGSFCQWTSKKGGT